MQLRVGEAGEHRSGAEEVIGVPVGQQDGLELLAESCTQSASRSPSAVVMSASTRTAWRSPAIRVDVVAGHVAGVLSSQPGPPGTGL